MKHRGGGVVAQNTHNILQWLGNLLWLGNRVCITCYDVVVSGDCGTHRFNHNRHVKIIIIATATFIAPVKRPSITALTKEHCASNQDHCFRLCLERPSSGPEAIRPRRNDDHHPIFVLAGRLNASGKQLLAGRRVETASWDSPFR